jgi:hypothetical protein
MKMKLLLALVVLTGVALPHLARAQKDDKPWTDWSKKEAEKVLTDSAWSHTQVETNTAEMFYTPTADPRTSGTSSNDTSRLGQGATNQSVDIKYRIRFFSARPVRQALARMMELQQKLEPAMLERLRNFAELQSSGSIIVTVSFEASDGRTSGKAIQAFAGAVTGTLKTNTYLERSSDGKRLFIEEYVAPGKDGFGARFIFLRDMDGQPFISPEAGSIRFYSEFGPGIKLNTQFKVADMKYKGQLEY